jgi:ubiquinone/menaquinone biosynthesis C-methylase UbiE
MIAHDCLMAQIDALKPTATVLDVGCGQYETLRLVLQLKPGAQVHGCDIQAPPLPDDRIRFTEVDMDHQPLPYPDDQFDFVILQHVLEHVARPVPFMAEVLRVLKPGGRAFVEAPSDRATKRSYPFAQSRYYILNYYDDPTHVNRPWTPQSLYRLALYYGCTPALARYEFSWWSVLRVIPAFVYSQITGKSDVFVREYWRATGWSVFAVIEKPVQLTGKPPFRYFSLRGRLAGR